MRRRLPPGRDRVRWLLGLSVACAVVFVAVYVGAEYTTVGEELDEAALEGRNLEDQDVRDATDALLLNITASSLGLLGFAIAGVALLRRRIHLAVAAVVAILGANVTSQILKAGLPRPNLLGPDGVAYGQSLPSGHATAAMSLAVALALVLPARYRSLGALPVLAWAIFVGTGTLATGWHRPSDVIAAYAIAVGWAALTAAGLLHRYGSGEAAGLMPPGALRAVTPLVLGVGAIALVVGFIGFAIGAFVIHADGFDAVDTGTEFVLATVAIVGAGLVLAGALLLALRGVSLDPVPRRGAPSE